MGAECPAVITGVIAAAAAAAAHGHRDHSDANPRKNKSQSVAGKAATGGLLSRLLGPCLGGLGGGGGGGGGRSSSSSSSSSFSSERESSSIQAGVSSTIIRRDSPTKPGICSSSPRTSAESRAAATTPRLVIIEGESGIGKTRLMLAAERAAACESMFECFSTAFSTRREVNFGWWSLLLHMQTALGPKLDTLLTGSQRSRIMLLMCVGKWLRETGKEMGSMGHQGLEIRLELVHALLLLVAAISSTGAAGVMLGLDDAAHLDPMVGAGGGHTPSLVSAYMPVCDVPRCHHV